MTNFVHPQSTKFKTFFLLHYRLNACLQHWTTSWCYSRQHRTKQHGGRHGLSPPSSSRPNRSFGISPTTATWSNVVKKLITTVDVLFITNIKRHALVEKN